MFGMSSCFVRMLTLHYHKIGRKRQEEHHRFASEREDVAQRAENVSEVSGWHAIY